MNFKYSMFEKPTITTLKLNNFQSNQFTNIDLNLILNFK